MVDPLDLAIGDDRHRVGHPPVDRVGCGPLPRGCVVDETDHGGRLPGPPRKAADHLEIRVDERGPNDEILGRIPGHRQLGKKQHVGAFTLRPLHGFGDQLLVALEVSDGQVQLCSGHSQRHAARLLPAGWSGDRYFPGARTECASSIDVDV